MSYQTQFYFMEDHRPGRYMICFDQEQRRPDPARSTFDVFGSFDDDTEVYQDGRQTGIDRLVE